SDTWLYSDIGVTRSSLATRRMVRAPRPSVSTSDRAVITMRRLVSGSLTGFDSPSRSSQRGCSPAFVRSSGTGTGPLVRLGWARDQRRTGHHPTWSPDSAITYNVHTPYDVGNCLYACTIAPTSGC